MGPRSSTEDPADPHSPPRLIVIDGTWRAEIAVGSDAFVDTIGDVTFGSSDTGETRLDFDPFGVSVGIQQNGQLLFILGSLRP